VPTITIPIEDLVFVLAALVGGGLLLITVVLDDVLGGVLDAVDERERCGVGVLPVRRRPVGDDEDVLAGGRLAVPAVGHVEHPPSDDIRSHVAVQVQHEVGRRLGGPGLVVGAREAPGDIAVA